MIYNDIYFAKNDYSYSVTAPTSSIYKKALILYKNNAINLNAPLLAGALPNGMATFNLKDILAQSDIFTEVSLYDLPNTQTSLPFMQIIKVQTADLGSNVTFTGDEIKFVPAHLPAILQEQFGVNYLSITAQEKRWFSLAPAVKVTDLSAKEYLYYLNYSSSNITNITVHFRVFKGLSFADHTITATSKMDELLVINTSWQRIKEVYNLDDSVTHYEVYLSANSEVLTQLYTYYVDHYPASWTSYLYFKNQFGLWDTIRFVERTKQTQDSETSTFESSTHTFDYLSVITHKLAFKTDSLADGWLKYYADELLGSSEIYLKQDNSYIRLSKVSSSIDTFDPAKTSDILEIEFKLARTDTR